MFINRNISDLILDYLKYFPVVCVTGPRQSGKTTLIKKLFPEYHYFTFEDPENLLAFQNDPKGFLKSIKSGAVLDEAQNIPELFSYLQGIVDETGFEGKFIVSGSQNFLLLKNVSQSLAGRTGIVNVLPFAISEIKNIFSLDVNERLLKGSYPRVLSNNIPPEMFYPNYVKTFIERDILNVKSITDKTAFYRFLKLCAARCSQILNYSQLAVDCGISVNTAKSWLSLLESSFIVLLLPPYFENISKQLIKSPKLYFYDTGLVTSLLDIKNAESLPVHPMYGALFENMIISEIIKISTFSNNSLKCFFLRDKTGHEIDLLIKNNDLTFIEIKSGYTFKPNSINNLNYFSDKIKHNKKYVMYQGNDEFENNNVRILNWLRIVSMEIKL